MKNVNPCVTGDTKVWTVEGFRSFKELADLNDDVEVYCLDENGKLKMSKMFHPRITGYNVEIVKVTLSDGAVFFSTPNHMFLTKTGYTSVDELMEGDEIAKMANSTVLPEKIDDDILPYTEYEGTKKGTVIKKCEVTGEEFECIWDEREICVKPGCENQDYTLVWTKDLMNGMNDNFDYVTVESIEFLEKRENVYNGTVAVYHNYFTVDETTQTAVNQLNCGELNI